MATERKIIEFLRRTYHVLKGTPPLQISSDIILDDEYIKWLTFANAGMLNTGNLYCIDYAARHIATNNAVIEIGSFCGLSVNIINYYLHKYGRNNKIISSDKWEFEGHEEGMIGASTISHKDYKAFVKNTFQRNVLIFSSFNLPYHIEALSDDFFAMWNNKKEVKDVFERDIQLGGAISFAFIDGNHTYDFAKRDFENTDKFLEVGGFILFDDSSDNSIFECKHLMSEIKVNPQYELVIKNPNYLFKKIA